VNTVKVSYHGPDDMHVVTTSRDAHKVTANEVYRAIHPEQAEHIAKAFQEVGYKRLKD
jgi:hypothetical protein